MPRAARTSAAWARKWCRMPAPAPCANTYSSRASCGRTSMPSSVFAKELVESLEHAHELGLLLEHFDNRVVPALLHALQRFGDRPVAVVKLHNSNWTIANALKRMQKRGDDPVVKVLEQKPKLMGVLERLNKLLGED